MIFKKKVAEEKIKDEVTYHALILESRMFEALKSGRIVRFDAFHPDLLYYRSLALSEFPNLQWWQEEELATICMIVPDSANERKLCYKIKDQIKARGIEVNITTEKSEK